MSDEPRSFEWRQFFVLAQELGARDDEAALRSAVSRAYYAVFHAARRYLLDCEKVHINRHDTHTAVWDYFDPRGQSPGVPRLHRQIGKDGARLRELRNQADYDDKSLNAADLHLVMTRAERLLNLLAELTHSAGANPPMTV